MTRSASASETVDDSHIVAKSRLMVERITKSVPLGEFLNIEAKGDGESEWESFRLFIDKEEVSVITRSEWRSWWRVLTDDISFIESLRTRDIHGQVMQHFSKDRDNGTWCVWINHHNCVQCLGNRWPTEPRLCPRLNRCQCVPKTNISWIIIHTQNPSWRSLDHVRNESWFLEDPLIVTWSKGWTCCCYCFRFSGEKMRKKWEKKRKWKIWGRKKLEIIVEDFGFKKLFNRNQTTLTTVGFVTIVVFVDTWNQMDGKK